MGYRFGAEPADGAVSEAVEAAGAGLALDPEPEPVAEPTAGAVS